MPQAQAVKPKTSEITEAASLQMTRNLLLIAIYNITYLRGLFPDKYFAEKNIQGLGMKVKKLVAFDHDARRLIDWIEKGVADALQKKYLKVLLFGICSGEDGPLVEEYEFFFSYPTNADGAQMSIGRPGGKNAVKPVNYKDARESVQKMVRTLMSLMRTLDNVPEERTLIMKLLYYDDITPADYEPPYFRGCTEEDKAAWVKTPIRMRVGDANSGHHAVALKVRTALDSCEDENENKIGNESMEESVPCEDGSTIGLDRTNGSEVTRHGNSVKRPRSPTISVCQPAFSRESSMFGQGNAIVDEQSQDYMNVDHVKASKVDEPIYQSATKKVRSK